MLTLHTHKSSNKAQKQLDKIYPVIEKRKKNNFVKDTISKNSFDLSQVINMDELLSIACPASKWFI